MPGRPLRGGAGPRPRGRLPRALLTDFRGVPGLCADWGAATASAYHVYPACTPPWHRAGWTTAAFSRRSPLFAHERVAMEAWISLGFGAIVIDAMRAPAAAERGG
ncbi:MAG: hypothetical protein R2838_16690 [Caldilineaceae bacterium]